MIGSPRTARRLAATLAIAAAMLVLAVLVNDAFIRVRNPFTEGTPRLDWRGIARVGVYITILGLLVGALLVLVRARGLHGVSALTLLPEPAALRVPFLLLLALAPLIPLLLVASPASFSAWSLEDGPVEWLSAALLALATLLYAAQAVRRHAAVGRVDGVTLGLLLLALACFLIAGEEASWLQRVIGVETPDSFVGTNEQNEMNLHNFATDKVENAFYFGAGFVMMVVLPVWGWLKLPLGPLDAFAPLLPPLYLVAVGTTITAYNYDMWNGLPTQIALWGSSWLLVAVAACAPTRRLRAAALLWVATTLAMQAILLGWGGEQVRRWDITEYKELFIAAGLALHAAGLWLRPASARRVGHPCATPPGAA